MSFEDARANLISGGTFTTPFGAKRLVYTDWTASARAHQGIEDFILRDVLPFYGNTHDHHSLCGHQSTAFREEARQIVAQTTNAKLSIGDNEGGKSKDVVVFAGTGATGATNKLVHILGLRRLVAEATLNATTLPVVLVGPFEHHSNLLPWRETGARVLRIQEDAYGQLDLLDLQNRLVEIQTSAVSPPPPLIVGTFAAASNVTGVLTNVDQVTALLHRYGALAIFDYATAGPYVPMDMNPPVNNNGDILAKDAIIFSPHKFLGGVNTPGVLVVKKYVCNNPVPSSPGGGTVFFVTEDGHRFLSNRSEREEGGTPDIVGTIRAGLACQLKTTLGSTTILKEEMLLSRTIHQRLSTRCPNMVILGPDGETTPRLPIFSFLIRVPHSIRYEGGKEYLHYNYVTRLLNDIFGIQARGGCACAGPYAQDLLGMSSRSLNGETYSDLFETSLLNKNELLRPGFTRLSFPWMLSEEEVDYVCNALQCVSEHGWRMLPQYKYDHSTGEWSHKSRLNKFPHRIWLSRAFSKHMQPSPLEMKVAEDKKDKKEVCLADQLRQGIEILSGCDPCDDLVHGNSTTESMVLDPLAERLRWFVLPSEVRERMTKRDTTTETSDEPRMEMSVQPKVYQRRQTVATIVNESILAVDESVTPIPSNILVPPAITSIDASSLPPSTTSTLQTVGQSMASDHTSTTVAASSSIGTISTNIEEHIPANLEDLRARLQTPAFRGKKNRSKRAKLKAKISALEGGNSDASKAMNNAVAQKRDKKMSKRTVHVESTSTMSTTTAAAANIAEDANAGKTMALEKHPQQQQQQQGKSTKKLQKLNKRRLMVEMGRAIGDWSMIKDGDRILVGVSGGKDSLTLLHLLLELKRRAPINFDVGAVTVDPGTEAFDPSPLIPYMAKLGVPYFYENQDHIFLWAEYKNPSSICSFCARMKRGRLYACCRREGYNVLALGQHLDDLAESFLMGAFLNGELRAMKACYETKEGAAEDTMPLPSTQDEMKVGMKLEFTTATTATTATTTTTTSSSAGDHSQKYSIPKSKSDLGNIYYAGPIRVVRPLVYVREHETREFARNVRLPVINENCPACFEAPKERRRVKKLLAQQESLFPATFKHLRRAMIPLMSAHATRNLQDYAAERLQSGRIRWGVKEGMHTNECDRKQTEEEEDDGAGGSGISCSSRLLSNFDN